jgi:hypothetical protein
MTTHHSFIESDGCTLKPIPTELLTDIETMQEEVLGVIWKELKRNRAQYNKFQYETLMVGMIDASGSDCQSLTKTDLRAILSLNIQFVKLYKLCIGESLKNKNYHPHDVLSFFLDFLLFIVELHDPRYNLLTVNRRRYDICHAMYLHYDQSPVQEVPLIAWRNQLLASRDFYRGCSKLQSKLRRFKKWVFARSARVEDNWGWMATFDHKQKRFTVKGVAKSDPCYWELQEFCREWGLEMVGTYLHTPLSGYGLHFLPQRVHVDRSDYGVVAYIPRFYSVHLIKNSAEKDFADLDALFDPEYTVRSSDVFISQEQYRQLGALVRKVLKAGGLQAKDIRAYIAGLLGGWTSLERIVSLTKKKEAGIPDRLRAIQCVDAAVAQYATNAHECRLWAEFCRYAKYRCVFDPFQSDR